MSYLAELRKDFEAMERERNDARMVVRACLTEAIGLASEGRSGQALVRAIAAALDNLDASWSPWP